MIDLMVDKIRKVFHLLKQKGLIGTINYSIIRYYKKKHHDNGYNFWIRNIYRNEKKTLLPYQPLIALFCLANDPKHPEINSFFKSLRQQDYKKFETFIFVKECEFNKSHFKNNGCNINIIKYQQNDNPYLIMNEYINTTKSEFCSFINCNDFLSQSTLSEIVNIINDKSYLDFIYSDEDKYNYKNREYSEPFFKPDWSPDTFTSFFYTGNFAIYKTEIIKGIGGFRDIYKGLEIYDMALRFTEKTDKIAHINKVLYHACKTEKDEYSMSSLSELKCEILNRKSRNFVLETQNNLCHFNYKLNSSDLISVIIPTRNNPALLKKCIESIQATTNNLNYEIIVVENNSDDISKSENQIFLRNHKNIVYTEYNHEFNYSAINNYAVNISKGNILVFLNDDTEIITNNCLEYLCGHAKIEYTGCVGAKLLYPYSNLIQHIGIVSLPKETLHSFCGHDDSIAKYHGRNRLDWNVSALTGACLAVERKKFKMVEGFDESLKITHNDIDLCFKLLKKGFFNVIKNDIKLYHHESISRGKDNEDINKMERYKIEMEIIKSRHPDLFGKDPFYNINLKQDCADYLFDFNL